MENSSKARIKNQELTKELVRVAFYYGTDSDEFRTANQQWYDHYVIMRRAEANWSYQLTKQFDSMIIGHKDCSDSIQSI